MKFIPIRVQYRHVHLSAADQAVLFGADSPRVLTALSQRGQVVYEPTVSVTGPAGARLDGVRVIGPSREQTQVELSASEAYALGLDVPVRLSGDVLRTPGCVLAGPQGTIELTSGTIIPARHLHCSPEDAAALGVSQYDTVTLALIDRPETRIDLVTVRVHPLYTLELHLTADEAAEFWLHSGDRVMLKG